MVATIAPPMLTRVEPGDVIADRFVVEAPVGHGGMGAVFRARDRLTGDPAAVKVLRDDAARHFDRFVREARVLAELRAHERGSEGDPDECDDLDAAARGFERAGNRRVACVRRVNLGSACASLGRYDEAERALRDALADAERMGLANAALGAKNNLALALARLGRLDEALSFATDAARGYARRGERADPRAR